MKDQEQGIVPDDWIVPVYKKDDHSSPANYQSNFSYQCMLFVKHYIL